MSRLPMRFLFAILLPVAAACGGASGAEAAPAQADTRVYECPMQCIKPGEATPYSHVGPGDCPVCGMHLTPRAEQPTPPAH